MNQWIMRAAKENGQQKKIGRKKRLPTTVWGAHCEGHIYWRYKLHAKFYDSWPLVLLNRNRAFIKISKKWQYLQVKINDFKNGLTSVGQTFQHKHLAKLVLLRGLWRSIFCDFKHEDVFLHQLPVNRYNFSKP